MKKIIFSLLFISVLIAVSSQSALALDRNALIQSIRSGSTTTNAYNVTSVIINTSSTTISGPPVNPAILQTIQNAQNKLQELRNRFRNLH